MSQVINNNPRRLMLVGLVGTIVAAVCCFTPLLVSLLVVLGLGALTGYLDLVLLPTLVVFFGLFLFGAMCKKPERHDSCCERSPTKDGRA